MPIKKELKLHGKVAVVTGAARGIGRAVAIELARQGADIAFSDIQDLSVAGDTLRQIQQLGGRALFVQGDVASREDDQRLIQETVRGFGRVDILVNNAGRNVRKPLLELEPEDVEKTWGVSLWGVFHCSQLAAQQMAKQGEGGSIVIISSVHASRPYPNASAYNGAKAAVNHMAATWALELASQRIRVNAIEPGWIDTPGERSHFSEDQIRERGKALPFGRLGRAEEIAKAVLFLVSDEESSYITGSCLRVDGGFSLSQ